MAVEVHVRSLLPTPRNTAAPSPLIKKRRSSLPAGKAACGEPARASAGASSRPPLRTTSKRTLPVARITSWLPAGTATGAVACPVFCAVSPGRRPGSITGGGAGESGGGGPAPVGEVAGGRTPPPTQNAGA